MSIDQVANAVEIAIHKLPYIDDLYKQAKDEVNNLQRIRQGLVNDIQALKCKLSILEKTALSSEQERKKIEQRLQDLTAQKDILAKGIAKISNNNELNQMVKENAKVALSENKQVISVAFTAPLQTLTSDPQMINIIYKILTTNDIEQHKDNNDNAIKYYQIPGIQIRITY